MLPCRTAGRRPAASTAQPVDPAVAREVIMLCCAIKPLCAWNARRAPAFAVWCRVQTLARACALRTCGGFAAGGACQSIQVFPALQPRVAAHAMGPADIRCGTGCWRLPFTFSFSCQMVLSSNAGLCRRRGRRAASAAAGRATCRVNASAHILGFAHAGMTAEGDNRVLMQKARTQAPRPFRVERPVMGVVHVAKASLHHCVLPGSHGSFRCPVAACSAAHQACSPYPSMLADSMSNQLESVPAGGQGVPVAIARARPCARACRPGPLLGPCRWAVCSLDEVL